MQRRFLIFITFVLAGLAAPAAGHADGLPVLGFAPNNPTLRGGQFAYTTRISGSHTRLERRAVTGRLIRRTRIAGAFTIPIVAYDGSASGLSADGRTLVLIRPRTRFPQRRTRLAVVDPGTLTVRRHIVLHGDFSFDAIAPDGRWIYLIQYTSAADPTRYRVRALDTSGGRLLPHDIVDPHDRGEAMRGSPLTRVASPDGRWAYTLYDGNGHPFVHALDTAGRTARCIDVPPFPGEANPGLVKLNLVPSTHQLVVRASGQTRATIDTRTLSVAPARRSKRRAPQRSDTGPGALLVLGAICLACGLAYGARRAIVQRPPGASARR